MELSEMFIAILRVGGLALLFGAGIPMLFALGMRAQTGDPIRNTEGEIIDDAPASPQMKLLGYTVYLALALVIVVAILWVARDTLNHYFGWELFGSL